MKEPRWVILSETPEELVEALKLWVAFLRKKD